MFVSIPDEYLQRIRTQSEKDYPHETCGILMGPLSDRREVSGIFPCRNVQEEYHAADPAHFPRTAKTAYFIDPRDLVRVQREARKRGCEIRVIYHSHTDAAAYFSEEDQKMALSEGGPAYPGVSYLVVSVRKGKAQEMSLFHWSEKDQAFLGCPVEQAP